MSSTPRSAPRGAALLFAAVVVAIPAFVAASTGSTSAAAAPSADTVPSKSAAKADAPAARLVVDAISWTSGEVARDAVVEHTFVLSNGGSAPLRISQIVSSNNVELSVREAEIAPGERLNLVAKVTLIKERPGAILKQIEVRSNDPDRPTQMLEVRIIAVEYVKPEPAKARWISVQQEMDGTISPVLVAVDKTPFRILSVTPAPPGVTVTYGPIAPPPAPGAAPAVAPASAPTPSPDAASPAWKFSLTLKKDAPVGAIVGTMLIEVDHPKQKLVPIPLSGFMRPVLAVTPYEVKLGEVAHVSAKLHELYVRNFATEPIHVTKVEHDLAGFGAATIEPVELGRRYKVKLPMDLSKAPVGPFKGTVRIFTDSRKVPVYTVPVDGTVQP
jgi:hypothetical protein